MFQGCKNLSGLNLPVSLHCFTLILECRTRTKQAAPLDSPETGHAYAANQPQRCPPPKHLAVNKKPVLLMLLARIVGGSALSAWQVTLGVCSFAGVGDRGGRPVLLQICIRCNTL